MPRKSRKKQTRLAFAPTATPASGDGSDEEDDRFARLSYGHPSMAAVRPGRENKLNGSPKSSANTKSSRSSKRTKSPVQPTEPAQVQSMPSYPRVVVEITRSSPLAKASNQDDSSDDDIVLPPPHRKRRLPAETESKVTDPILTSTKRSGKTSTKTSFRSPDETDELQDDTPRRPLRRPKRKAESSPIVLSDSDDLEEPVSSPVKRRRPIADSETLETPRGNRQDKLDIEEDLRDLEDSVVKKSRTRGRLAESARDKRLKHLEALRRRRAGQKETNENEGEGESDSTSGDTEEEGESDNGDSPSRLSYPAEDVDSDVESAIASNEDLDRYEDDFVLEDENTELGVPTEEIPFEFTRHAYKQPKEYFRDVVGWMVHNRLDPAFPRSDAIYEMAFMKLEDEVKGRAGSQLISSTWNAQFVRALLARPHMELTYFPVEFTHPCDACNRTGHPASADMKLYGKAYSLKTLEPLLDESDDDQSSNSDSEDEKESGIERDREGHMLPDQEKRFYLGKHCKANAQLAHTLTHWRFHLNEWVVDHLERMGQMTDAEVLRRNDMSQKRKTRNAIHVIEQMVEAGEIDKLWRDFHLSLKTAREKNSLD